MGSKCCSGKDAMPPNQSRNIDDMKQNLLETEESSQSGLEGVQIELETSTLIAYILSPEISAFDLQIIWDKVDKSQTGGIHIKTELQNIFLALINQYIESKTGRKANSTPYNEPAVALSDVLSQYFQTILADYNYAKNDVMSEQFFMDNFLKYLADPTPKIDEQIEPENDAPTAKDPEVFDMLSFISTSSTIKPDVDFIVDHTVSVLCDAMQTKDKERGNKVGQILASLTESQRIEVRQNYVGRKSESLQSALEETFSGDLLLVLSQLCRSSGYNDAECIETSRSKLNKDWSVINEVLMSRSNSQLAAIKEAYAARFRRTLLQSLLESFNEKGAYGSLMQLVLTDDVKILRKEYHPRDVKKKKVADDAKILYHILENTRGKVNKMKVIEMLCHRSWFHIAALCKEYGKKSNYDLKTIIEKKFGKNSKSGDALQKIIDVSRQRHSFFAQLLFQSMKGISVNDAMLIRNIVNRSEIDLGEISAAFSRKYGNGKTLLQFIRSNAKKGTYRNVLLRICGIGDNAFNEDIEETTVEYDDDDVKVQENEESNTFSKESEFDDHKESDAPQQTWYEYICSSPTMRKYPGFEAHLTARQLIVVMSDNKRKKDAKKLLIKTLTMINNKQRQDLKKAFVDLHPDNMPLKEATQNTLRKGKTMIIMLGLLQRAAEFHCIWIKQAIKNKKVELLIEILASCSNYELQQLRDLYKQQEKVEVLDDINQMIKTKSAQSLIAKILECKRPETTRADKKLCKIHLHEMRKILKEKNQKKCKAFFAKLFTTNSYSQINYEVNKFNTASDHTLNSVVKKVMGSGASAVIVEHIMKIATNRFAFYAEKLRDSMKGISTSEQVLIRILLARSEKDLGDIVEYFALENYGEGKTLRQWIENAFKKGSFQTSLLRIAGVSDDELHADLADDETMDYESHTESNQSMSDLEAGSPQFATQSLRYAASAGAPQYGRVSTEPHGAKLPSVPALAKKPSSTICVAVSLDESDSEESNHGRSVKPVHLDVELSPKIVISTPEMVMDEINLTKSKNDPNVYDPYNINEKEFGQFIIDKVTENTAQRLMQHLKAGKGKISDDEMIRPKQVIHVLLFACVLYLKYLEKTKKRPEAQVDKKKLKQALIPAFNWMLKNKFEKEEYNLSQGMKKSEYKKLGKWLQEYYQIQKC